MATVRLRSLSDSALFEPAVDLFTRLIAAPSFPSRALRASARACGWRCRRSAKTPARLSRGAFMRALYGDHPYAHEPVGDEAGLDAIGREDLMAHHRRYYTGRKRATRHRG